jgi:hypothetical protein
MNHPGFTRAASLILDAVEESFSIVAPGGRGPMHDAIVQVLDYYCLPKLVPGAVGRKEDPN